MAFEVAEGVSGTYYYHLRDPESGQKRFTSLCDRQVMQTQVPLSDWAMSATSVNAGAPSAPSICRRHHER